MNHKPKTTLYTLTTSIHFGFCDINSNSSTTPSKRYVGIFNQGATCYLNSLLQVCTSPVVVWSAWCSSVCLVLSFEKMGFGFEHRIEYLWNWKFRKEKGRFSARFLISNLSWKLVVGVNLGKTGSNILRAEFLITLIDFYFPQWHCCAIRFLPLELQCMIFIFFSFPIGATSFWATAEC